MGLDLAANRSLFEGLVMHLKPAIYRMKQKMGISNPLLDKIKRDYAELFAIVKQAGKQVFDDFYLPDEETGYLVMHFGAAILGSRDLINFRTLVVCSSGIGTSKMLATRLQKEFPELKHIQNVSVMEFKKMKKDNYQLVISTIPIPDYESDYIVVNPFLNKDEIEKIRSFINEYKIVNSSEKHLPVTLNANVSKKSAAGLIEEMRGIQEYTRTIATILEDFELNEVSEKKTTEEILTQLCQSLYEKQKIDDVEAVVKKVLEREKLGGIGIPETGMALFHSRTPHVQQPCFVISVLQTPIKVVGMDENDMNMINFILLLSPENSSDNALEVLSYISSLLIESDENIAIFQSGDYGRIMGLLTARFDQFFTEKLKELRSVSIMTKSILAKENILLNTAVGTKEEAIRVTGSILVDKGYVDANYIEKMLEREALTSTYMGNFVAIPHGTEDSKLLVKESGISFVQVPQGVDFGSGNIVKLLIGIAGKDNEHLDILSNIAIVCSEEENIEKLVAAKTADEILAIFEEVN